MIPHDVKYIQPAPAKAAVTANIVKSVATAKVAAPKLAANVKVAAAKSVAKVAKKLPRLRRSV